MKLVKSCVSTSDLITQYVRVINVVLQLPRRVAEVLSLLLYLGLKDNYDQSKNINSTANRSVIKQQLGLKDSTLSIYLHTLKAKHLLLRGDKGWVLNRSICPVIQGDSINVDFSLLIKTSDVKAIQT